MGNKEVRNASNILIYISVLILLAALISPLLFNAGKSFVEPSKSANRHLRDCKVLPSFYRTMFSSPVRPRTSALPFF